ncbi:MAG: ribonuclease P protein component [Patescibacteria group bacterium]
MLLKKYKLKRDNDFKKVFKQGRYCPGDFIKIKFLRNNLEFNRFAFVVGLKISKKATQRNKIKRCLEKATQSILNQSKTSFDLVVMVEPKITKRDYQGIEEELIDLFKKIKLIK